MNLPLVADEKDQRAIEPLLTDVGFWAPVIRDICLKESIAFDRLKAGFESSSAVFILDDKLVLKIFTPYLCKTHPVEVEVLEALGQISDIQAPKIQAVGLLDGREEWPYLIMDYVAGQPIREVVSSIERNNLLEIAEKLGQILHTFHHLDSEVISKNEQMKGGLEHNLSPYRQSVLAALEEIKRMKQLPLEERMLPAAVLDEMEALYHRGLTDYLNGPPVLAHCDLTEDHLILKESDGKWHISGLIDFADACVGLKEFDWHDLWFCMWARDVDAMKSCMVAYDPSLDLDEDFRHKCLFFTMRYTPLQQRIHNTLLQTGVFDICSLDAFIDLIWPPELIN